MKNICFLLLILFVQNIYAQKRAIAFEKEGVKLIHDLYEGIPWQGIRLYPFTSILYIEDNGQIDTLGRPDAKVREKIFFNGKSMTFVIDYFDGRCANYSIIEKSNEHWKEVANYLACDILEHKAALEQQEMYRIKTKVLRGRNEVENEIFFDVKSREIIFYDILEQGKKKNHVALFPERIITKRYDD
jgi:hypothetical protein